MLPKKDKYRLILAGVGYAHVYLLKRFKEKAYKNLEIIVVSSYKRQYYSGMASGYLEDIYSEKDIYFDLEKMCKDVNIEFLRETIERIDVFSKKLWFKSGKSKEFDLISFNIGSEIAGDKIKGFYDYGIKIKPLINLVKIKNDFKETIKTGDKILVVGSGKTGVELSCALKNYCFKLNKNVKFLLVDQNDTILKDQNDNMKNKALKILSKYGIDVFLNKKIIELSENKLIVNNSEEINYDYLIWTTGTKSNNMFKECNLPLDNSGYMLVNKYLQSINYPYIFGVGDCIGFENQKLDKVGIYSVREAPFLYNNIFNYLKNKKLKKYIPQKKYLSIMSIGKKKAILQHGNFFIKGNLAWKIKNKIDNSFIKK
ncbi:MAG: FAD-dependent oxidoreductase [Clostridiales bacterium]